MRISILVLLLCISQGAFAAKAAPLRNLAYEDEFVWYLATRLTTHFKESQERKGFFASMDEGQKQDMLPQVEILYHNFLVECAGPLPDVAKSYIAYDYFSKDVTNMGVLRNVAVMEPQYWPMLLQWNDKVLPKLLETLASGHYDFFPKCTVKPFRDQNPAIVKNFKIAA